MNEQLLNQKKLMEANKQKMILLLIGMELKKVSKHNRCIIFKSIAIVRRHYCIERNPLPLSFQLNKFKLKSYFTFLQND